MNRPRRNARTAFTLIELLTVIAIVAVLAGMVIGSLRNVRQHVDQTKCASNLRQIYGAIMMYTQEHDDRLPCFTYNTPPGGVQTTSTDTNGNPTLNMHLILFAYAYISLAHNGKPVNGDGGAWMTLFRDNSIFACPSDPRPMGDPEEGYGCTSYAWNRSLIVDGLAGTPVSAISGCAFIAGDSPQSTAQVYPNKTNKWPNRHGGSSPFQVTIPPTERNDPDKNPRGENNLLFVDGHIESRTADEIPVSTTTKEGKLFWGVQS